MINEIDEGEIIGLHAPKRIDHGLKKYDFKRPDKFSKEQIRTVAIIHETFSRLSTTALSASLRMLTSFHVAKVDQMTYSEFTNLIGNPTTMAIVIMAPLRGSAVLQIDTALTYAIVDRIFGGPCWPSGEIRDLSRIERWVMEEILNRLLGNLGESWSVIVDLKPRLGQIETNPHFAQIVPPAEMVILITFDVKIGDVAGNMRFCIPYLTIEPLIQRLTAQYWYSSIRRGQDTTVPNVGDLKVECELLVEGEALSLRKLSQLKRNSLIKLPGYKHGDAYLYSAGNQAIKLRTMREGRQYTFFIDDEEGTLKEDINFLTPPPQKEQEDIQTAPLETIKVQIRDGLSLLERKITALANRQDEIADRLYLSSPEQEVPSQKSRDQRTRRPFEFIRFEDRDVLYLIVNAERPQTIALILSFVEPNTSAYVLSKLDEHLQVEVAERITILDRLHPEVLKGLEKIVEEQYHSLSSSESAQSGGVETITEILNLTNRSVEKHVIEGLTERNEELAQNVKAHMFVFDDVSILDEPSMRVLYRNIDRNDLLVALKSVDESVKEFIYAHIPEGEVSALKKDFEKIGRTKLSRIDQAQQRIISKIRELEQSGEIEVARKGDVVE